MRLSSVRSGHAKDLSRSDKVQCFGPLSKSTHCRSGTPFFAGKASFLSRLLIGQFVADLRFNAKRKERFETVLYTVLPEIERELSAGEDPVHILPFGLQLSSEVCCRASSTTRMPRPSLLPSSAPPPPDGEVLLSRISASMLSVWPLVRLSRVLLHETGAASPKSGSAPSHPCLPTARRPDLRCLPLRSGCLEGRGFACLQE